MLTPLFRVKRYTHPKYKFLARGKVNGKWRRRYFRTEAEAIAFARQQNAGSPSTEKDRPERPRKRAKSKQAPNASPVRRHETADYADNNFAQLNEPTYTGPYIQRYFGDHWSMHLPFAYDLMREFRPKVFVELGVWKGESYFSFCQSAADHRIPTKCYGIDTWRGDVHMGDFDPEIGIEVAEYNWRYSSFSELRTTTFAETVGEFADGTIDLLHIDGAHTYEDVKRDFKAWLPKVSTEGIVLLHDVAVHDRGFGVWRLWEEIAKPGQSFLFEFGYGLGVWKKVPVVNSDSVWLRRLFELNHVEQKRINAYYVTAAAALALWHKTQGRKNRDEMAKPLPVQVFVDQGGSFSETSSMTAELVPGRWQSIRFDHLEKLGPKRRGRIRLDPVNCLAFVNISSIRLITDSDKRVFYSASSAADFAQIDVSEGVLKHETDGILELVATDSDPQVFLPELNFPSGDSWHLEVDLEVHTAPSNIILRQKETFAELRGSLEASRAEVGRLVAQSQTAELQIQALQMEKQCQNREQQAQAKLDREQIASLENELRSSQRAGKELEARRSRTEEQLKQRDAIIGELEVRRSQTEEQLKQRDAIIGELEARRSQTEEQLKQRDAAVAELEARRAQTEEQLISHNSRTVELTDRLFKLNQEIKSCIEVFGLTRQGLQNSNSGAAVLIRSLFHDIRLIRKRKSLWKACRLFRSTLSREGTHDIPSNPKITAEALKQKLQGIERTLKSKKTSPKMALNALAQLIVLQNQVRQILASLRLESLLKSQRRSVKARELVSSVAASKFSTLFDAEWYLGKNPEVKKTGMDPLQHYLRYGAREGRNPHPLFETKWYLSQAPELANIKLTPLEHYVLCGAREGRSPHPEFDSQFYIKNHHDSVVGEMTPLGHYLTVGWILGYRPHPRFDPQFYLRANPDVAAANMEPLTHFVLMGRTEGRKTIEETISFETYRLASNIPSQPNVPADSPAAPAVRAIAFYLPQFHPIPENDRWWGKGFTDWNNVRAGQRNFPGHYQPHVPTDLGYYDLRETEVLQKQTELARAYGIHGFCFYYYWFRGKVLLDLPVRRMVESGKPDFPFCICWANENWTRRWDGLENDILLAQSYSPEDDLNFIRQVESTLLQKNYIRIRGMPLLLVYRPSLFPDSFGTTQRWRDYFRRKGHGELHLVMVRSFHDQTAPEVYGFDAAVQFPPHFPVATITTLIAGKEEKFKGTIYDYTELRRAALHELISASSTDKTYAAVMPSWDNTARRGSHAVIWANSSPESYYEWLSATVEQVQKKEEADERLIFINAWNEWAEGCHLEPDEKYGYAWLNATALALRRASKDPARPFSGSVHPAPPKIESIKVPALTGRLKLAISVLFYHREDLIRSFLQSLLQHILTVESRGDVTCSLNLAFNYQPSPAVIAEINDFIAEKLPHRSDAVHILENGFNLGFGAGHNAIFQESESDIFLILNSDVRVTDEEWLPKLVDGFRHSDAAIVGLIQTASRLREDGCGIPIQGPEEEFDFVDGSALAVRSDLARRFGLFSPSYDYFYFEDVDLCLRYRQMGLQIALLDAPYEHERSSSSRLLPQFAVENVLDRNRARLFEKWGKYLRTRTLSNRIGVRFLEIDRQLQCASLPALFGLLAEHGTAVIDLWGVHQQLRELFQHPRIRLIPSWQTLREDDYLRHYDLATNQAETPRVYDIANRVGCDPDFEGAKAHLESLIGSGYSENSKPSKTALLYVARKSPLFDGKEPNAESFAPVAKMLHEKNFSVRFYTDYGTFEVQNFNDYGTSNWKHVALCPGMELLEEIASADIIVTSDDWIAELGQLLQKRTFLWLGATSCRAAIWDFERAGCFSDQSLSCLGCYHQFGRNRHNVCLRGDIACMRPQLAKDFVASLETFLDGEPLKAVAIHPNRFDLTSHRSMPSTELSLEHWPSSTANSVLVLTPVKPQLDERVLDRARELANRALKGMRNCRVVHDNCGEAPGRAQRSGGQPHPYRQVAMASLRQKMVERYLQDERWIFWVDADIIDYPPFLIEQLIQRAEGGIVAPLVLMEGEVTEPVSKDGFGPGRFFDIAGFVENGRWARFTAPYFDQPGPIYRLDSVGSCYLVNADLYRMGAAHAIDPASEIFLNTKETWSRDAIARNQRGPANAYTEHYNVCQFAIRHGLPVQAFADLVASHQKVMT